MSVGLFKWHQELCQDYRNLFVTLLRCFHYFLCKPFLWDIVSVGFVIPYYKSFFLMPFLVSFYYIRYYVIIMFRYLLLFRFLVHHDSLPILPCCCSCSIWSQLLLTVTLKKHCRKNLMNQIMMLIIRNTWIKYNQRTTNIEKCDHGVVSSNNIRRDKCCHWLRKYPRKSLLDSWYF